MYDKRPVWRDTALAIAAMIAFSAGCATVEPSSAPRGAPREIGSGLAVGDRVVVTLQSGDRRELTVRALERDAIVGRDERIRYRDVRSIAQARPDPEQSRGTMWETSASLLAVLAIAAIEVAGEVYGTDESETYDAGGRARDLPACRDFGDCRKR